MMSQHDNEGRLGNAVQSRFHILPPLGRKGLVAAGKAVVRTGNVKGRAVLAGPFGQALSPPGRRLYGAVAQNAYRRRLQHGRNGFEAAVILVIAVAVIYAVGKFRRHLPQHVAALRQERQLVDEVTRNFHTVYPLRRQRLQSLAEPLGTDEQPQVDVGNLADFIAVEVVRQVRIVQVVTCYGQIALADEIPQYARAGRRHGDDRRDAAQEGTPRNPRPFSGGTGGIVVTPRRFCFHRRRRRSIKTAAEATTKTGKARKNRKNQLIAPRSRT